MADAMSRILGTPDHVFSTYYSDNRLCELRKETGKRLHQALDHQGRGDTVFIVPRTPLKRKNRQATGTTRRPASTQDKRKSETKKDVVVYFYVQSGKPPKELRLEGRTSKDGDTIYLQWEQNQAVLKKFKEDNDLGPRERLDVWDDTEDAWSPKKTRDKILLLPGSPPRTPRTLLLWVLRLCVFLICTGLLHLTHLRVCCPCASGRPLSQASLHSPTPGTPLSKSASASGASELVVSRRTSGRSLPPSASTSGLRPTLATSAPRHVARPRRTPRTLPYSAHSTLATSSVLQTQGPAHRLAPRAPAFVQVALRLPRLQSLGRA
ncbi:uncharacterized protein BXZ73DRAFT_105023 [Epithele typhae]|uniref:uncharacterized protein n=1 Tax=Epithele typhae TaxID=378194 RepID=UPI002007A540|nr:uncharacterized protein BXZ73DRAFT_105023 [Epithele typhae]KAH9919196.1 hypothetical protein BXZ73DRAFT_105023 [Epithele typhae]